MVFRSLINMVFRSSNTYSFSSTLHFIESATESDRILNDIIQKQTFLDLKF